MNTESDIDQNESGPNAIPTESPKETGPTNETSGLSQANPESAFSSLQIESTDRLEENTMTSNTATDHQPQTRVVNPQSVPAMAAAQPFAESDALTVKPTLAACDSLPTQECVGQANGAAIETAPAEPAASQTDCDSAFATSENQADLSTCGAANTSSEQENQNEEGSAHFEEMEAASFPTLTAEETLRRLHAGKPLINCRIQNLILTGTFEHPLKFMECDLPKLCIQKATFKHDLTFVHCRLQNSTCRRRVRVQGSLSIRGCRLRRTNWHAMTIGGNFDASGSHFEDNTLFRGFRIDGDAKFWQAEFVGWTDFKDCHFEGEADLRSIHCGEGLCLLNCYFHNNFLFRGSTVCKKFELSGSTFEKMFDLSKAKLHDFVYLEDIKQGEQMRFALRNALTDRLLVQPRQLTDRLQSECDGNYAAAMDEYGLLKRVYQTLHRYEEEDWAFYRFKLSQRRQVPRSWWRPWTKFSEFCDWLFLDLGCGYGTNPYRALQSAGVLILLFSVVYAIGIEHFILEKPPIEGSPATSLLNRLVISFVTSVSVFISGFGGDILSHARGWVLVPLLLEATLGTLLWGLFIVAFGRKVIR